jgi:hypothetical protein
MRMLAALLAIAPLYAQADADALLAGIRQKMRDNLARLPDYTCRLTIERSFGSENAKHLHPVDTVHIEVGYVEGKELYAWPGQKFANKGLDELMPAGGAVGTGDFALHVKSIFLGPGATFTYTGRSVREGHEVIQFDFKVPRAKSRYLLRSGPERQDVVGYHGSFRADAGTLLLERLEITLDDIPPALRTRRAGSALTYGVTRIGGADFLLPRSSELFLVDSAGNESRNRTRFEQCRQYLGESVVSFADPAPAAEESPRTVTDVRLPTGVLVDMVLKTPLEGSRAVIGDPIRAVAAHDVVKSGAVLIPKGAAVTGRITRIGQRNTGRVLYQVLGLRMESIEFGGHRAEFVASMESLGLASAQVTVAGADLSGSRRGAPVQARGESILFIKGNSLHIPSGAHMYWRTLSDASE